MLLALASERTNALIDELSERLRYLDASERCRLIALRQHCNEVIHGKHREGPETIGPLNKSAWSTLNKTILFVSLLLERGALMG